ncbi:FlxA-like family protein [Prevotella sp. LCP21S3_D2]|uniref:FlxA-like family protein n=1 Tax=Prevotella sp. LCP21S3_D2 TaxID=3438800 RepID=UPI003F98A74E
MKRKYLSALLMGVLTLSSVSTFTSCKDYDDDISNLQEQIDKLATADQLSQKVAELQALISSNKSDITSLQSELGKKTTLDEVKAVLADYATKEYVDGADATLKAAIDALETGKVAELEAAVKAAQAAADKAAADAEKANAEIVETLTKLATKAEVEEVQNAANKAIAAVESKNAEALEKAQAEILETLKGYATTQDLKEVADAAGKALKEAQAEQAAKDEAAKKAADKALSDAVAALNTAIGNAQTKANTAAADASKALADLVTTTKTANDAKKLADENKQSIADALKLLGEGYSAENTVAAAIKAIQAQVGTPNKELGTLDTRLAAIESVLNGVKDDDTKLGLATKVTNIENKLKDIIGEYTTMVTEVSLMGSFLDNGEFNSVTTNDPKSIQLKFISGEVKNNYEFGKEEVDNTGKKVPAAPNQQAFVENTPFNNQKQLMVRVNPTNAVLTKDMIKLVDSQGNDLDNVLEIGEPKQYTELLTRASKGTGLWTIPVKVKAGVASSAIEQKVLSGIKKDQHILYAVAIKNTKTQKDAEDRYVASTYDVTVPKAEPFKAVDNINDVKIWSESTMTEKGSIKLSEAKPTTSYVDPAGTTTPKKVVRAKNNETIKIDFSEYGGKIKYFYVVRDDNNTDKKSDASELNAWNSYSYGGNAYGQVVEVDPRKPAELTININGKPDDEIGFRVFAINYDGTLAPKTEAPKDGKPGVGGQSFVVYVGDQQNTATVGGKLQATKALGDDTGWLPLTGTLKDKTEGAGVLPETWKTNVGGTDLTFKVEYAKNGDGDKASKYSDIKYIKFTLIKTSLPNGASDPSILYWKDNLKAEGKITTLNSKKLVENEIEVSLAKVLPTVESTIAHMGYKWKAAQKDESGKYTAYVYPANNAWTSSTVIQTGYKNMTEAINGLKTGTQFEIEGMKLNPKTQKYSDPITVTDVTNGTWTVNVPLALIDPTKEHKTTISYNYGKISSEKKDNAGAVVDYVIPVETVQTVFVCPLDEAAQSYTWTKKPVLTDGKVTGYKDVNYLTYGSVVTVDNVNLLDYILGSNKFDGTVFGGMLSFSAMNKYASIKAELLSDESGNPDFFTVEFEDVAATTGTNAVPAHKKMVFKTKANTSNPLKDVKSHLIITLTDAFGHEMKYPMEFTVKRAK